MRVMHIIIGLDVGGAELTLERLISEHLSLKTPIQHSVISLTTIGEIGIRLRKAKISTYALNMKSVFHVPIILLRLIKLLRKNRPDIVQTWMYHGDLVGGLAARAVGIENVIWGIRTTDISKGGSKMTRIIRWLCARMSGFLPTMIVCAAEASRLNHIGLGYKADRMITIPNGVKINNRLGIKNAAYELRKSNNLSERALIIGMVGRFNAVKGHYIFIQAAKKIASQCPNSQFMIVGRDCNKENAKLMEWIRATGIPEKFVLLGQRSDVPTCLRAMDIFIMPSRTEGFPNVLAEAMAMARPCIATDVGDAALILQQFGLIVPSEDPDKMAEAACFLIRASNEFKNALGKSAQEHVNANYTLEKSALSFSELYSSLMQKS